MINEKDFQRVMAEPVNRNVLTVVDYQNHQRVQAYFERLKKHQEAMKK